MAIAIIEKINELVQKEEHKEDNQERQKILRENYLSYKDPLSLRYSSKLILNENNNDFYQSNLINLRKPLNMRSLSKSNQLLWQAFECFSSHLEELPEVVRSGEKLTAFLTDTVAQRPLFIQINVENELNAYTVFETLNARGIELSSTDLLKNYLFSLFQGPDDLQEAQRQWRRIINTVQMERFPDFLRYYLSLRQPRVRRRLFQVVRESVKNGRQAFELLDQLESYSGLFVALGNANDEFWRDTPENQPYIRELELFRVKQAYPTLFAAYEKFVPGNFTRLLKLVSVFSFRYTIVSSLNPSELETLYSQVAIAITNGEINNPRQVFDRLHSAYVSDEKFSQDFSLLSISTKGQQKKKLVQYILSKLESDSSGIDIDEDSFSIEHILPESPSSEWLDFFSDTQIEAMVYRLGNLTPLEPSLNRQIGNKPYQIKQPAYQQSVYKLTKDIVNEEWTPKILANRQRKLAQRAVQVWKSDFSK